MSKYKKVIIPKKNLPETYSSKEFKERWIEAFSLNSSSVESFILYLEEFYTYILKSLKDVSNPNYFLISTLSYVDSDFSVALKKLRKWLKDNDPIHEFRVITFERLHRIKKIPTQARPLMAEYYFTLDFKYLLSTKIKSVKLKKIKLEPINDYDYIKTKIQIDNSWYNYLYYLFELGYTKTEISELTKLSRKTITIEGNKLWECLKHKL